jgi:type 1 glutamine amidotransferase/nicotinamidase-related amidase
MEYQDSDAARCSLPEYVARRWPLRYAACLVFAVWALGCSDRSQAADSQDFSLSARTRIETSKGSGRFHAVEKNLDWKPAETAVVVCDMWDNHWCRGASSRVAEMVPRMNEFLKVARSKGMFIIHCPSDCMDFYKDTPQRKRAMDAPAVKTERPIELWRHLDKSREGSLPIDDSDGGCDCEPRCKSYKSWTRQIAAIEIAEEDAITDGAEAYYLMRQRDIKNVIVLGVHTNMCVLGRPFSIRQMVYQGQNVVLVRDLTDTMYNPRAKPFVSHFTGTDLVIEHIERHWCPTIVSGELLSGDDEGEKASKEFRFSADKRPTVAVLMAEDEYETERTLPEFARERLAKDMRVSLIYGSETERNEIPGIEAVRDADVLLVSVRRRPLKKEELAVIREHVAAGKGVVGIRTASHAFAPLGNAKVGESDDAWPEFDRDVLGGNYTGHYGTTKDAKDRTRVEVIAAAADHPVLRNIGGKEFVSSSWLYKVSPLAKTATPLLLGHAPGDRPAEPVAWTHVSGKSRVFYTSLGHKDDFQSPAFMQLLENGIRWATAQETPAKE